MVVSPRCWQPAALVGSLLIVIPREGRGGMRKEVFLQSFPPSLLGNLHAAWQL